MSSLTDLIGGANLADGINYNFTTDRFLNENSAIYLNNGYLKIPPGIYINGDFSITLWINLLSYKSNSRIIEFGNGQYSDNVIIEIQGGRLRFCIINGNDKSNFCDHITSFLNLIVNVWYHVAFTYENTTAYIYINGVEVSKGSQPVPNKILRNYNYIGESNLYYGVFLNFNLKFCSYILFI